MGRRVREKERERGRERERELERKRERERERKNKCCKVRAKVRICQETALVSEDYSLYVLI